MSEEFPYPRFPIKRRIYKFIGAVIFKIFTKVEIIGKENLPEHGPVIVVANHFSFADPAILIHLLPWHLEFLAGTNRPAAPNKLTESLPELWGVYNVQRGTSSRYAFNASSAIMKQNGILAIFPEGGAWATVLRPARPGVPLIAAMSKAPILPIGIDGMTNLFPIKLFNRPQITLTVGKPFGPYTVTGRGKGRRVQLDEIGNEIIQNIAKLLPPEQRGICADDPALVEAARAVSEFPF
ncbi:MAG: 1-acyl-sn-glycerol-3-phosphate acyltransferase [Cellvibrionaceae bacterium]|jgi:1-acyl-sn-glycerol-3-phosphate acyltransferase